MDYDAPNFLYCDLYTRTVPYGSYNSGNGYVETCTRFLCRRTHKLLSNGVNAVSNSCVTDITISRDFGVWSL